MNKMKHAVIALWKEDEGLTTVEYAVAGGLIAAGVVASFMNLGTRVKAIIDYIYGALAASPGAGG